MLLRTGIILGYLSISTSSIKAFERDILLSLLLQPDTEGGFSRLGYTWLAKEEEKQDVPQTSPWGWCIGDFERQSRRRKSPTWRFVNVWGQDCHLLDMRPLASHLIPCPTADISLAKGGQIGNTKWMSSHASSYWLEIAVWSLVLSRMPRKPISAKGERAINYWWLPSLWTGGVWLMYQVLSDLMVISTSIILWFLCVLQVMILLGSYNIFQSY